jgi:hypothetical protein
MARNADSMGWVEYAAKCRDMAERSRKAGRDISANETIITINVVTKGQLKWEF